MPAHDYRCLKCQRTFEVRFALADYPFPMNVTCDCGSQAHHVWVSAPHMSPDPYWAGQHYDVQLGMTIRSKAHLRQVLAEKGLTAMGPQEYQHNLSTCKEDSDEPAWDSAAFAEAAEKAWNDTINGNVPPTPARKLTAEETEAMLVTSTEEGA